MRPVTGERICTQQTELDGSALLAGSSNRAARLSRSRADSPMMAREIAAELAARYQIVASNMDAMIALVAKVRNTLARPRGLASEMRGDAKAWRVEA